MMGFLLFNMNLNYVPKGLANVVGRLFERHREVKTPLDFSVENFGITSGGLELYHDATKKYGTRVLSKYPFLSAPLSINFDDPITREIHEMLKQGQNARFTGEAVLAWDRLLIVLGEDTRAGLVGVLTVGDNNYSAKTIICSLLTTVLIRFMLRWI